jgi:hypothetical protein
VAPRDDGHENNRDAEEIEDDDDLDVDSDDRYRVNSDSEGEAHLPFAAQAHDNYLKEYACGKVQPCDDLDSKPN